VTHIDADAAHSSYSKGKLADAIMKLEISSLNCYDEALVGTNES